MRAASDRPLRADARANHDRLLAAAARAFTNDGAEASLKAIAQDAGVGIGTLYRRFPTREHLVEATYRTEVARLCVTAEELAAQLPARSALRLWSEQFLDFLATKTGMAEALRVILAADDTLRLESRQLLIDAVKVLLAAGKEQHTLRHIEDPFDVLLALGGIALITGASDERTRAHRLLDQLFNGLQLPHGGMA